MSSINLSSHSLSEEVLQGLAKNVPVTDLLIESERQFRNLVMQSPIAMAIFRGADWEIDIANDTLLKKIWQRELHEVQGKKLLDVFPELASQPFPRLLKQVSETGVSYTENEAIAYVNTGKGKTGKYYFDFEYAPLFEPDGKTVSGIIVTVLDVTEKVVARKKAEENEVYLQRMADNMPAMLFMSGKEGYFTYHNNQWYDYTGMTKEESNGFGWLAAVHPDQREETEKIIKNAIAEGKKYTVEFRLRRKDNAYRWFVKSGKPSLDISGAPEGYLGTLMDIHERKLAEEILKESRQSLKLAIESAELGTWDYDPATNTLQWDERTKKIFGLPPGEFVTYELFLKGTHEKDRERVNEAVYKATSGENDGDYAIEYRIFRIADNEMRWIRAKGKAFFNEKKILERFLGTVYDITEQKESIQKMEDAESRLRLATEGTGIATWDLDLKNFSIIYSPRLAELFGKPNSKNITHAALRAQVHPDDRQAIVEKAFDHAIKTGLYYYEARVVWPDNSIHWIRTHGKVIFDEKHEPQRMLGTMLDITAEKQAMLALQQSEIRYRHLIHSLPVAFYTCDTEGRIGIYNEAALELWGRSPADNDRWCGSFKIFQPDGSPLPLNECPMAMTLKTGKVVRGVEIIIERPDGKRVNVLPHPQPVFDEKGDIVGGINMLVDISDRKIAEQNTARLAAIVQSSDDAIVSKTLEGIITSWNPGAEKLFGYGPEEMIGQSINKLIPEDRLSEEVSILKRIKKGEKVEHFDTIRRRRDGKLIDISLTISPIKDSKGHLSGASKIARDITVQKNLYNTLQENEQRLQMVVQAAQLGTWEYSIKTKETKYSDRYLEILGFSKNANPTDQQILERLHPEDIPIREKALETAGKTGLMDVELRFVHADKSFHWVKMQGKVFYDKENNPDRMLGTVLDVTPQKNAFNALRESELLFKTIANVAPVGLWMTDKEANNNFVNNTWIDWTGVALEDQYNGGWMSRVLPEDAVRVRENFIKSMVSYESFSDEFRIYRTDGKIRWCLTEGFPYYNNQGGFEGYAGSVTDITERKMIQDDLKKKVSERTQELHQVNSALEKSNEELEQFAYVASHDLQEPLRKIKTFVGRLQETIDERGDGQGKVYMEKIVSAAGRMSDLIRDLLEYSRTAKVSEKHTLTDLNVVLENVKNDFELLIHQKKAVIKSDRLPVLHVVSHQMNQLFTNLLSNSLKFIHDERLPVINIISSAVTNDQVLSHGLDPEKSYTEIIFSDNGIGFSNEFSEKIFEIFQRLNPRSSYSGSGIGLSICRKIVLNHGGLIFADSIEDQGTSFHIILPVSNDTTTRGNAENKPGYTPASFKGGQ